MPLKEFTEKAYEGLAAKKENVPIGMAQDLFTAFEETRQTKYAGMVKAMGGGP